jgi:hypothetical protein
VANERSGPRALGGSLRQTPGWPDRTRRSVNVTACR